MLVLTYNILYNLNIPYEFSNYLLLYLPIMILKMSQESTLGALPYRIFSGILLAHELAHQPLPRSF